MVQVMRVEGLRVSRVQTSGSLNPTGDVPVVCLYFCCCFLQRGLQKAHVFGLGLKVGPASLFIDK